MVWCVTYRQQTHGRETFDKIPWHGQKRHIFLVAWIRSRKTRLLGHPQPQMYPPVALNQYTLVNRTHKHYIYMFQGPTNILKSHQSSTICKTMEVIWWTFFHFLFSFWGVLGKRTLNPEVLKCHEDRITLDTYVQQGKTMDNKFYIYVKTLTSLAKWGPGGGGGGGASIFRLGPSWFTYTLHLIIIYMSNIEAIW